MNREKNGGDLIGHIWLLLTRTPRTIAFGFGAERCLAEASHLCHILVGCAYGFSAVVLFANLISKSSLWYVCTMFIIYI
ncbi:MAG: hypothetical protein VB018_05900 [Lachnospiraceae bacterium]|nr:hypothetical protein [Lachnospiraceae bacterium]